MRSVGWIISASLVLCIARSSGADSAKGIQPALDNPLAPRGGVLMLPLTAERPGDDWPRTLEIRLADDRRLTAEVAWMESVPPSEQAVRWTQDPRRLRIRTVARTDDTSLVPDDGSGAGPYLIARLPIDGAGTMKIQGQTIHPAWCDLPSTDPLDRADAIAPEGTLTLEEAPDRPDPQSPFEYWRWVLLADRLDLSPPVPAGDELEQLAAIHYATLWRIGLKRLATLSERIAFECRTMLTRTAVDRARTVATWQIDPYQASTLLSSLIDFAATDQSALASAAAWLDRQPTIILWPEDESGDQVRLAMTSLRDDAIPVSLQWLGAGESAPASRLQLEPGVIAHVTIDRMPLQAGPLLGAARLVEPPVQTLRVQAGSQTLDMACGPRVIQAKPPGVTFRPLSPPITLADALLNRAVRPLAERATSVQVRRLGERWEVFADCRRIVERQQTVDAAALRSYEDLRGIEAITILIGAEDDPSGIWLTVPEHDYPAIVRGPPSTDLQVHKRSFGDRWHCRIVLPEQWFSAAHSNPAFLGLIRSHNDSPQLESGPAPTPPWRISVGRIALDLAHWDDLPSVEAEP